MRVVAVGLTLAMVERSASGQPRAEDEAGPPSGIHLSLSQLEGGSGRHEEADSQVG